jgi:hypothetical protein
MERTFLLPNGAQAGVRGHLVGRIYYYTKTWRSFNAGLTSLLSGPSVSVSRS